MAAPPVVKIRWKFFARAAIGRSFTLSTSDASLGCVNGSRECARATSATALAQATSATALAQATSAIALAQATSAIALAQG